MADIKQEFKFPALVGSENYRDWKFNIKQLLEGSGLWRFVVQEGVGARDRRPADPTDDMTEDAAEKRQRRQDDWDMKEAKASLYIVNNISVPVI